MPGPYQIEGYAIASVDGMLAASDGLMPDSLKIEADQRFFEASLDRSALVVHGRMSYEGQPNSPRRKRLILTRKVASVAQDPSNPNAKFWNPAGLSFAEAAAYAGCEGGAVAILGGPDVYSLFLKLGYDVFYLCRAPAVRLPGGVPVFAEGRKGEETESTLASAGLKPGPLQTLGPGVTLVEWTPEGGATLARGA
jgi:dihydrofolate reductase